MALEFVFLPLLMRAFITLVVFSIVNLVLLASVSGWRKWPWRRTRPGGRWWVGRRDADSERRACAITSPISGRTAFFTLYFTLSRIVFWTGAASRFFSMPWSRSTRTRGEMAACRADVTWRLRCISARIGA